MGEITAFGDLSSLRIVRIQWRHPEELASFPQRLCLLWFQLTHLEITDSPIPTGNAVHILSLCPQLVLCSLGRIQGISSDKGIRTIPSTSIHLLHLEDLTLNVSHDGSGEQILHALVLPSLASLGLDFQAPKTEVTSALVTLLKRSSAKR